MAKQIFNRNKIDFTKQPMFFGEDLGVQRYDVYKYPFFDQSTQRQLGFFWRPEEVSLLKDSGTLSGPFTLRDSLPNLKAILTSFH